jgi:thiol-disulfide isomerase/thioredoxin
MLACAALGARAVAAPPLIPATAAEVMEVVRRPGARAVVVNVWATWCVPCVEEFPYLVRLHREHGGQGVRLVLVSADFGPDRERQVVEFLERQGVDFPSYVKLGDDMQFIDTLAPRWSGALPATLIFDSSGTLRELWEGASTYARLEGGVLAVLDGSEPPPDTKDREADGAGAN